MLSPKLEKAFNEQIVHELYSSHLYLAMAAYFEAEHFKGFAKWMVVQAGEEHGHAKKFYDEIVERGGRVKIGAIEAPPSTWKSPLAAFEAAYEAETKVTTLIHGLADQADKLNDRAAGVFLQWFIKEQVEEESAADEIVQVLRKLGTSVGGMYQLDHRLGKRE